MLGKRSLIDAQLREGDRRQRGALRKGKGESALLFRGNRKGHGAPRELFTHPPESESVKLTKVKRVITTARGETS